MHDGQQVSLVKSTNNIVPRTETELEVFLIKPAMLTWSLLTVGLLLSFYAVKRKLRIYWFDAVYFSVLGLIGWIVFLLWFYTDHVATKDNLNLIWAVPFYLPLFLFWNRLALTVKKWVILIFGGIDLLIIIFWFVFPQNFHHAFIPLILLVLLRFAFLLKSSKKDGEQLKNT